MRIVAGINKNQSISTPKGMATRPTSGRLRAAVFNICQMYIEGAEFLDLFAGSGAMGLEALSRGASQVTFIDTSKDSILCVQKNLEHMKHEKHAKVYCGDVLQILDRLNSLEKQFDIVYVDPPYDAAESYAKGILNLMEDSPLLKKGGVLFFEVPKIVHLEEIPLEKLKILSSRQMGRSILYQFQKS
jgi:16S rRNA (guanine966-N2)-methyltransferase